MPKPHLHEEIKIDIRSKKKLSEEFLKPAQEWDCKVCGEHVVSKRRGNQLAWTKGDSCEVHRNHARCGTCGEWFRSANAHRKTKNTYCSDFCRSLRGKPTLTHLDWHECICGGWMARPDQEFCKSQCRRIRTCPDCPAPLAKNRQRCDDCRAIHAAKNKRQTRRKNPQGNKFRSRARHHGVPYEPVNRRKVYERDEWMCGICGELVDKALKFPDVMSASLDHIIPMAKGGPHSYANTQCAHFICNSIKSDRVAV